MLPQGVKIVLAGEPEPEHAFDMQHNQKRQVFELLLERESSVLVTINPSKAVVPSWFAAQRALTLEYGLNISIPDLRVSSEGVSATLSFGRTPHHTHVPWDAVGMIADYAGNGAIWQDDMPQAAAGFEDEEHTAVRERGSLRVVSGAGAGTLRPAGRLRAV
jgi:stringent starvation protein B